MKYKIIIGVIVSFMFLSFKKDSCDIETIFNAAIKKLNDFEFLKEFKIIQKKKKDPSEMILQPLTLNSGVTYRFYAVDCPDLEGKLVINIYNSMKKEFMIASTYDKRGDRVRDGIEFKSQTTGNFCIGFYYVNGNKGAGVAISSFLPKKF